MKAVYDPTVLLTRQQVARRLGFSEHTVARWVKRKIVGFPRPILIGPNRAHRFRAGDIEQWIDRQESHPAPKRLRGAVKRREAAA